MMGRPLPWAAVAVLLAAVPLRANAASDDEPFEYDPPGQLAPGSGEGRIDEENYAPGIRFPIEEGPAYANSQVYGLGGSEGGGGQECDAPNYAYPWQDNYCETRSWDMPLCPAGVGHQGQDIRPATCDDLTYWTVAADAGTVTSIGSYSLYVTDADGTRYDYLHGRNNIVAEGQAVAVEERLNQVSNSFGDGGWTTVHLHFNIKQDIAGVGFVYVPTYMALVESYEHLFGLDSNGARGAVETKDCTSIVGWAQNLDAPDEPAALEVYFDGARDDPSAIGVEVLADFERPDLCDELGSCTHGFELAIPRRLRDGQTHPAYVYVMDDTGGATQAEESPVAFACLSTEIPDGVKRTIDGPEVLAAWGLSLFWDAMLVADEELGAISDGPELPGEPRIVRAQSGEARWMIDVDRRREVPSPAAANAWGMSWDDAEVLGENELDGLPIGTELPDEAIVLEAADGRLYVMDIEQCDLDDASCSPDDHEGEGDDGQQPETSSGTDSGSAALPDSDSSDDGCGCVYAGHTGPRWLLAVLLLGLRRRRLTGPTRS